MYYQAPDVECEMVNVMNSWKKAKIDRGLWPTIFLIS